MATEVLRTIPEIPEQESFAAERNLVIRAQAGDEEAIAELFENNLSRIHRYSLKRLGNSQDAEDLASEVFERMLNHLPNYQYKEIPFGGWLYRIAYNLIINKYRKEGLPKKPKVVTVGNLDSSAFTDPANLQEKVEQNIEFERVLRACQRLSPNQRLVIELRFVAGLSSAETAQVLGKTKNNVKVLQSKAIKKLRQIFNGQEESF